MNDSVWSELHKSYTEQGLQDAPNIFAEQALPYFAKQGNLLDLGAGLGQDSRFFANHGYKVTSTDLIPDVLKASANIETKVIDLRDLLPFKDATFNVVYAHLSLHYFDNATTQKIMDQIYRVLKPGGIIAFLVNSTSDPEFNTGTKVEDIFFEVGNKYKRYFSITSTRECTKKFKPLLLDDQGETYKDNAVGVHNLIRYIGQKT